MRSHVVLSACCALLFGCGASPSNPGADAAVSSVDVPRVDVPVTRDAPTDAEQDPCAAACRLVVMARCDPATSPPVVEASCLRSCRQDPENNPSCRAQSAAFVRCAVAAGVPQCREGQPQWTACASQEQALNTCITASNADASAPPDDASAPPDDASAPPDDAPEDIAETVIRCTDTCAAQQAVMCSAFNESECVRVCRQQVIFVSPQCRAQHRARADCRVTARYTCNVVNVPSTPACDMAEDAVVACERGPLDGGM
ncbi:MAG: hypothetical protein U0325_22590 [Polyangiales bacterium]